MPPAALFEPSRRHDYFVRMLRERWAFRSSKWWMDSQLPPSCISLCRAHYPMEWHLNAIVPKQAYKRASNVLRNTGCMTFPLTNSLA